MGGVIRACLPVREPTVGTRTDVVSYGLHLGGEGIDEEFRMQATASARRPGAADSRSGAARRPFVTLYTDSAEPSGMGAHMLALADELSGRAELAFMCHDSEGGLDLAEAARRRGHEANVLPVGDGAWRLLGSWLRARRPDLFHVHAGIGWEGLAAPGLARRAGVRAVLRTEHLPDLLTDQAQRQAYADMLEDVDARICVSEASRESYAAAAVSPLSVVRNGVPPPRRPRATRSATRRALDIDSDAATILTVARLTPQKGHAVLLDAARSVVRTRPDAVFLWVGEGVLHDALRLAIEGAGLSRNIRLLGVRDDVSELMAASDLFVLPSLFEGLPLALLEALQAGLPVVATTAPGTAEVFETDEAAELARPSDADALAAALLRVLNDPDLADELADRGQRLARRQFSAKRMGEETFALYARVLNQAAARRPVTLQ